MQISDVSIASLCCL